MTETSLPEVVLLDTTNLCNARCPFCPLFTGQWQMDRELRPAGVMPQGLFDKITAELALWDRKLWLIISANAEILQDPLLSQRLEALHRNGLYKSTQLLTNGQLLSQRATREILDAGIGQMTIGFDGATREVYEAHRVRCSYDRVLGNTVNLLRLGVSTTTKLPSS